MKDFDKFESSLKDALTGFDEIQPSKTLKLRIDFSLFLNKYFYSIFITNIIAFIVLLSFGWLFSEKLAVNESENINYSIINNNQNKNYTTTENLQKDNTSSIKSIPNKSNINSKEENSNLNKTNDSKSINEQNSTLIASTENNNIEIVKESNTKAEIIIESNKKKNSSKSSIIPIAVSTSKIIDNGNNSTNSKSELENNEPNIDKTIQAEIQEKSVKAYSTNSTTTAENKILLNSFSLINFIAHESYDLEMYKKPNQLNYLKAPKYIYEYEIFIGSTFNRTKFTFRDNVSSDDNLVKTSSNPSFHLGGNFAAYYKNWFVRIGANYNKTQDKLDYNNTSMQDDSITYYYTISHNTYTDSIIGWNTNVTGIDSLPIIGVSVHQTFSQHSYNEYFTALKTNTLKYRNTYSYVNIPLMIGRRFSYRRVAFDIAGGVSWSHIIQSETQIVDANTNKILATERNSDGLQKDIINGALGIGIGYSINGFSQLFFRTQLEYNINDIFDETYFKNQNAYRQRFSLGMRYNIK